MNEHVEIDSVPPLLMRATANGVILSRGTFKEQVRAQWWKWLGLALLLIPLLFAPIAMFTMAPNLSPEIIARGCIGGVLLILLVVIFACCALIRSELEIVSEVRIVHRRKFGCDRQLSLPAESSLLVVSYDKAPTPTDNKTIQLLIWDGQNSLRRLISIPWGAQKDFSPQQAVSQIQSFLQTHLKGIECQG